ncbi:putative DNA-binding domain-containing protein [Vibrio sp. SCSIO 43135]|uniref:HvfC/BufC N-terminal domain-containing protein n=1 Tax=Vibrio sp. SCSIO 43135 TaxID=2819096 RepID=UPI0020753827|nr:DNA-binding domain-containing protein [Vibrio sp. SCSIO 43135]USD41058.1 putative DNA-binding domain-containing protein [Vibrio sp. SCSIO 43135]
MTVSLAQLQGQFAKALHYQATGEECHVVSDLFSADERMQIYRNNFVISLSEVLSATYPMVEQLLGEECFAQLARQHVLCYPLTQGDVSHYGEHFARTIEQFPAVLEAAPYAPEVARFEWSIDLAQQQFNSLDLATDVRPLSELSQIAPELHGQLRFHLQPSVIAYASQYAVFSLQLAILNQQFDGLEINQAEQGVIACDSQGTPYSKSLPETQFQLLSHLQAGQCLADVPAELLGQLNGLIELALIAGFTLSHK